jgi:pimeloyl-ACP methyl ester carboxylesterase
VTPHYHYATVDGHKIFYREAGPADAPAFVLLHGFPSSSHMFRELIPKLAGEFHVIAPDYLGFGYSDHPSAQEYAYTFDNLADLIEKLLFGHLKLSRFSLLVHDYGASVGFRIATHYAELIEGIVVHNGNAYVEGISGAFEPLKPFWASRSPQTEKPVRSLLTATTTRFQYTHGAKDPTKISPDSYTLDQHFLDRPGNDAVQLDLLHNYPSNVELYDGWHDYFRVYQPRTLIVWGANDPFFRSEGATAFHRDLPHAELHLFEGGHFAIEEYTQEIADHIVRFLSRAESRAAS